MKQLMSRRTFFNRTAVAAAAAVAGTAVTVKLDGKQPTLATNTTAARMGANPRSRCPHKDQDDNPNHLCSVLL